MTSDKTTSQLLTELSAVSTAVLDRRWSTGALAGLPTPGDLGALTSSADPLAKLAGAGVGMLTPHVSFLAKPLDEFRGDSGAVTTSAQGMATAAADIRALADTFRQTSTTETSAWTGAAADGLRMTSAQFAEGITAIAEAAKTISGAIVGAGEEVVTALTKIVQEINAAVGEMIPVMADGIARAPLTMGASIAQAIAQCVAIASRHGAEIAAVMANLLANGMNLLKLVNMVLTIVHAVTQLLQKLAKLAESGDGSAVKDAPPKSVEPGATTTRPGQPAGTGVQHADAARSPGTEPTTAGVADPTGATTGRPDGTDQAASLEPGVLTGAGAPSPLSTPSSTIGTPSMPSPSTGGGGGVPLGGMAPMAGAALNTGTSGTRSTSRPGPGGAIFAGGPKELTAGRQLATTTSADDVPPVGGPTGPMAMGAGARGPGAEDAEHSRRYEVDADGDTFAVDDQNVIAAPGVIGVTPEPGR